MLVPPSFSEFVLIYYRQFNYMLSTIPKSFLPNASIPLPASFPRVFGAGTASRASSSWHTAPRNLPPARLPPCLTPKQPHPKTSD